MIEHIQTSTIEEQQPQYRRGWLRFIRFMAFFVIGGALLPITLEFTWGKIPDWQLFAQAPNNATNIIYVEERSLVIVQLEDGAFYSCYQDDCHEFPFAIEGKDHHPCGPIDLLKPILHGKAIDAKNYYGYCGPDGGTTIYYVLLDNGTIWVTEKSFHYPTYLLLPYTRLIFARYGAIFGAVLGFVFYVLWMLFIWIKSLVKKHLVA